jgi:2-amino-4-hydroxy-6-hydroxymethyldihydropteridine diphosphokinase
MANFLTYYLLLGGNEHNTLELFEESVALLSKEGSVFKQSKIYQSEPWGYQSEKMFFNKAIQLKTSLNPEELLNVIHHIEKKLGRTRNNNGYQDRGIDIDILLYENDVYSSSNLKIPHPLLHQRPFALAPLNEICPDYMHPILHKTLAELLLQHNTKLGY